MKSNSSIDREIKLSDVGVLVLGFNRPELLAKRIMQLSSSKINHLYISIDGGSASHTLEMAKVKQLSRQIFNKQKINIFHNEKNTGLVLHITGAISKVLKNHEYIVVIEDDIILGENFIDSMVKGLNLQKNLGQSGIVSGGSQIYSGKFNNKWRKTYTPSVWGWACSAKTWRGYRHDLNDTKINKWVNESQTWQKLKKTEQMFWLGKFNKIKKNPLYTWEYQLIFHLFKNNYVSLAPIFSLTGNEGYGDTRATHTRIKKPNNIANHKINNRAVIKFSKYSQVYINIEIWKNQIKFNLIKSYTNALKYLID